MDKMIVYRTELIEFIKSHILLDGVEETVVPSLFFIRQGYVNELRYIFHQASICIIMQGEKEIFLGSECFKYGSSDYLISSWGLPVAGQVVKATADEPYLAVKIGFSVDEITELIQNVDGKLADDKEIEPRAMSVCQLEEPLIDAVLRLVRLVDKPEEVPVFAPLYKREILYRVLQGSYGCMLRQLVLRESVSWRIKDVTEKIMHEYDQSLRVEELAKTAHMSVPTFHRSFKAATAMSPLQFQKQLRLQAARRLLLTEPMDVASAAFRVGYESPSQFSREYSRMFGLTPKADIKRLRG